MKLTAIDKTPSQKMKGKRKASANAKLLPSNGVDDERDQPGTAIEATANRREEEKEEGNREKVEEVEDRKDEEDDDEEGGEEEEDGGGEAEEERPKLDEGFYEIEAIRQKRIRKGQTQYLIKWRGWPETSNTWEPKQNLMSCSDVIEAFEERLGSGKGSRKRKRKHGGSHSQGKKKQQRGSSENNVTGDEVSAADRSLPSTSLNTSSLASPPVHIQEEGGDDGNDNGNGESLVPVGDNNGCTSRPEGGLGDKAGDGEHDPKLSELKGSATSNDPNADKFALYFPDAAGPPEVQNGFPTVDSADPAQNSRRTGSRRRKSTSVKRFREDPAACALVPVDNPLSNISFSCSSDQMADSQIIKILKPISFSASSDVSIQDVLVTFLAMTSDGREIIVDNKFLKTNNPLLLINYYEKHLKYST